MNKWTAAFLMCLMLATRVCAEEKPNDASLAQSDVVAMGAVLMDGETGRVLWGKNEYLPLPMASTTKIMTAIIALENGNMDEEVTVSKRAAAAPEVKMFMRAGEKIKLENLMYALMLESSNDAAIAIAEHVGGSVEAFCEQMTAKAKDLSADDTLFLTPNGLDAGDHHSTAYDMALITRYAMANPEFVKLVNTASIEVASDRRTYSLHNKNRLLREFSGANGVKTGFTGKAGQCFVGAAKRGDMQLISVVLASGWGAAGKEQKWKDTKKLLSHGFDHYRYETIIPEGAKGQDILIDRSKTPAVGSRFEKGLVLPLTEKERDSVYIDVEMPGLLRAPVAENQPVGQAKIFIGGELVETISILTDAGAQRHDLKTSLEKVGNAWLEMGTNNEVNIVLPEF